MIKAKYVLWYLVLLLLDASLIAIKTSDLSFLMISQPTGAVVDG